jgi:NADH dehydrogenase
MDAKDDKDPERARIVVVGGGYGGLFTAMQLERAGDVTLVTSEPNFLHTPLLYEYMSGEVEAWHIAPAYHELLGERIRFVQGAVTGVDFEAKEVEVAGRLRTLSYDYLVLAVGSVTNDFGTPGVREHCHFLDDRAQANRFRSRLLNHCLRVSHLMSADPACDAHVAIDIVGGGATGVELAAELFNAASALRHYGLEVFDESRLKVTLLEAGERILPALPEKLAEAARSELEALGVRVMTGTPVVEVSADAMTTAGGERIPADLMVWAAGVKGAAGLDHIGGLETTRHCQLVVRDTLQTSLDDRIFAIGDCCWCKPEGAEQPVPPRAQAAHQMAGLTFRNLGRMMDGRPLRPFVYRDHGSLVSLSRFSTVGSLMGNLIGGRMAIEGRLARFVYTSLYRMHLIAIHGWLKGLALLAVGRVNRIIRPRLKLH